MSDNNFMLLYNKYKRGSAHVKFNHSKSEVVGSLKKSPFKIYLL